MARYTDAVCRLCRREGEKLFLKGERCFTPKCSFEKRSYAPGMHGKMNAGRPGRESDYGKQLRAKQKVRRVYGIYERQFRRFYGQALRMRGQTGPNLLTILETRLANVVYRLGFANSRQQARQLVRHGLFNLNGHKADIPSMIVSVGDVLEVPEKKRKVAVLAEAQQVIARRGCPSWLEVDGASFRGVVKALPQREDIQTPINEDLIVELYSK